MRAAAPGATGTRLVPTTDQAAGSGPESEPHTALADRVSQREAVLARQDCYPAHMKTTLSSSGQITIPIELRELDRIEPGQEFDLERVCRGEYRLVRRTSTPNEGVMDWLTGCPSKGYFVQIGSESSALR